MGKPVFVASQLLNSMLDVPVPTRAEVADCADAVRQQADALMLSGETAAGQYPLKAIQTLQGVRAPWSCGQGPRVHYSLARRGLWARPLRSDVHVALLNTLHRGWPSGLAANLPGATYSTWQWRDRFVAAQVYSEVEGWVQRENFGVISYPQLSTSAMGRIGEEICNSAAQIAGSLKAKAIFVYTRTGETAGFVSRRRPGCPIFAVTGALCSCAVLHVRVCFALRRWSTV